MSNDAFTATHAAPPGGMQTWSTPDPAAAPDNQLGGGLPVQLLEETVGWGHVRCSNGWECWVDARLLVALGAARTRPRYPHPHPHPSPAPAPAPVVPTPSPPYEPLLPPEPQAGPGTVEMQVPPQGGATPPAPWPVPVDATTVAAPAPAAAPVEAMPAAPPAPAARTGGRARTAAGAARDEFTATHRAPATGLATRERPDPGKRPNNRIEPGLELQVIERAESWARVRCSNGWETWVDGRYLVDL